jgi:hypothetical protein
MSEDTGKLELEKIIDCLKQNHYEFEGLKSARMDGFMIADFKKDIAYSNAEGEYINDSYIKVTIEFDSGFDYKNSYRDSEKEFTYDPEKGNDFIDKLIDGAYGHGKKKGNRRFKRINKTKKNKKNKRYQKK